jgi:MerR HTH family regulatory protein
MTNKKLLQIEDVSRYYAIEIAFIHSLHDVGLLHIITKKNISYILENQLVDLEKIIRLHGDLEINAQGIDIVFNLLNTISALQKQVLVLKNR